MRRKTARSRLEILLGALCPLVILALALAGCGGVTTQATSNTQPPGVLNVVVSIVPQQYFVERIGGEHVNVTVMVPPGFSPATYEPKPEQLRALSEADVYVRIRVPFEEAWMDRIVSANDDMLIVDESVGIERIDGKDPHIWLSLRLVKTQAQTIYDGLVELDSDHEADYQANLEMFLADLDELDVYIQETLSHLENPKFLVFHPAWSYFARDYGLEMISVQIEGSDPSAAEMADLVHAAQENNIKVIFAQPEFSTESAKAVAEEIGGEVLLISPLAPDWLDNLYRVADTFAEVLAGR
ncbi:MAG: zinc ABC transporter substrate-binding protein [Chloroflexota bacterium]|nr:zinc ABC transporter substrate-binding protein [Chloroflexota bacterium]